MKHIWIARASFLAVSAVFLYLIFLFFGFILRGTPIARFAGLTADFVFSPQAKIASVEGRTNILILGKAGGDNTAPDLTDTIIFSSISHTKKTIDMVSIPRDIWIPSLRAKLNSAYYWGNQKQADGGLILAKSTVEEIVGQPIHYAVVVDFSGFRGIVDALGGVVVDVEEGFIDNKYPIAGRESDECGGGDPEFLCRYETVEFGQGIQMMDGEVALKFVRSRNAEGNEGTDFARTQRQQKFLRAIGTKALSPSTLLYPKKLLALWRATQAATETDMPPQAIAVISKKILQSKGNLTSAILSEDLLFSPPISPEYDNLYVFVPANGSWEEVHKWVEEMLQ